MTFIGAFDPRRIAIQLPKPRKEPQVSALSMYWNFKARTACFISTFVVGSKQFEIDWSGDMVPTTPLTTLVPYRLLHAVLTTGATRIEVFRYGEEIALYDMTCLYLLGMQHWAYKPEDMVSGTLLIRSIQQRGVRRGNEWLVPRISGYTHVTRFYGSDLALIDRIGTNQERTRRFACVHPFPIGANASEIESVLNNKEMA